MLLAGWHRGLLQAALAREEALDLEAAPPPGQATSGLHRAWTGKAYVGLRWRFYGLLRNCR